MALRLRTWLLVVTAGAALMALAALPPESPAPATVRTRPTPERMAAVAASHELAAVHGQLARLQWADSVEARIAAAPGGTVVHAWDGGTAAPGRGAAGAEGEAAAVDEATLRQRLAEQVAALPVRSGTTVGLFAIRLRSARSELPVVQGQMEVVRGRVEGRPYCAVVLRERDAGVWRGGRKDTDLLGPCAFMAAYGEPGDGVEAWLERAGYGFGAIRASSEAASRDLRRHLEASTPPGRFGRRSLERYQLVDMNACVAGRAEVCSEAVLEPFEPAGFSDPLGTALAGTPMVYANLGQGAEARFVPMGDFFLADLEAEHGQERFARFWTSDRPMPDAFQDAFGEPLDGWVRRWAGRHWEPLAAGPLPRRREWAGGLLWAALGMVVGVGVVRRRRVA